MHSGKKKDKYNCRNYRKSNRKYVHAKNVYQLLKTDTRVPTLNFLSSLIDLHTYIGN